MVGKLWQTRFPGSRASWRAFCIFGGLSACNEYFSLSIDPYPPAGWSFAVNWKVS